MASTDACQSFTDASKVLREEVSHATRKAMREGKETIKEMAQVLYYGRRLAVPYPNPCVKAAALLLDRADSAWEQHKVFENVDFPRTCSSSSIRRASMVQRNQSAAFGLLRSAEAFLVDMDAAVFACFKLFFPNAPIAGCFELFSMPSVLDAERNLRMLRTDRLVQAEVLLLSNDRAHGSARLARLTELAEEDVAALHGCGKDLNYTTTKTLNEAFCATHLENFACFTSHLQELTFDDERQELRRPGDYGFLRRKRGTGHDPLVLCDLDDLFENTHEIVKGACSRHFFVTSLVEQAQKKNDALYATENGCYSLLDSDGVVAVLKVIAAFLSPSAAACLRKVSSAFRDDVFLKDRAPHLAVRVTSQRAAIAADQSFWEPYDRDRHGPLPEGKAAPMTMAGRGWPSDLLDALDRRTEHSKFELHPLISDQLRLRLCAPLHYAKDVKGRIWVPMQRKPPQFCQFDKASRLGNPLVVEGKPIVLDLSLISKAVVPAMRDSGAARHARSNGTFSEMHRLVPLGTENVRSAYRYPLLGGSYRTLSAFYREPANSECLYRPWGRDLGNISLPGHLESTEEEPHVGVVQSHPSWASGCKFDAHLLKLSSPQTRVLLPWTTVPYSDQSQKQVPQPRLYSDDKLVYPAIGRCFLSKAANGKSEVASPRRRRKGGKEREMEGRECFRESAGMRECKGRDETTDALYTIEIRALDQGTGLCMGTARTPVFKVRARCPAHKRPPHRKNQA